MATETIQPAAPKRFDSWDVEWGPPGKRVKERPRLMISAPMYDSDADSDNEGRVVKSLWVGDSWCLATVPYDMPDEELWAQAKAAVAKKQTPGVVPDPSAVRIGFPVPTACQ